MIKFEKVSYEQFEQDSISLGFKPTREIYDNIKIPTRSTADSAGYDFVCPYNFYLSNQSGVDTVCFPTGIRVILPKDKFLAIVPRSGIGFKTGVRLANTIGVIDSDYIGAKNEGHIMCKLVAGFNSLSLKEGDKFAQGIILQYFKTDDDNTTTCRNGGLGSTSK